MRNTTKLKTLLLKYTLTFDMADDGTFILVIDDKHSHHSHEFEGKTYAYVLSKAYSYMVKKLKEE